MPLNDLTGIEVILKIIVLSVRAERNRLALCNRMLGRHLVALELGTRPKARDKEAMTLHSTGNC